MALMHFLVTLMEKKIDAPIEDTRDIATLFIL